MKKLLILLAVAAVLSSPVAALATPMALGSGNMTVKGSAPQVDKYLADYDGTINSSDFGYYFSDEEVFCVSHENLISPDDYTFWAIDGDSDTALKQAVFVADTWAGYLTRDDTIKAEAQKAVWKLMNVIDFVGSDGLDYELWKAATDADLSGYNFGGWYFADSKSGQDFLTPVEPVSEPSIFFMLGLGLIAFAGAGRKKLLK